ncbi:hypothetical protein [Paenibacillus arenosi]|uniref:Uncharacterized protein n=1 Tax=Paenibacillus arenosi TaxID=2774142 RepID=A0ABR9B124_9BACL|nr:hypothetical protein [Paenibacillus arenosi]MBD8498876.1 hypothetical protein [Paenibacillus arenosi]
MFGNYEARSPVSQPFVWVAEYADGTVLSEFDYTTTEENRFQDIEKHKLIRFGLIGNDARMYFEVFGGIFKILGHMLQIDYVTEEKSYQLTGQPFMYDDLITYKDAEFTFNPRILGSGSSAITQFNFGFKVKLKLEDVEFNFQAVCQIPHSQVACMEIKLVANKDLDGRVEIKRNGNRVDIIDAPLQEGIGGMITWELR